MFATIHCMRRLTLSTSLLLMLTAFPTLSQAQHPIYPGGPSFPNTIHMEDVLGQPGTPITLTWNGSDRWTGTDASGLAIAIEPVDGRYFISIGIYRWAFSDLDAALTNMSPPKVVFGVDRILPNGQRNSRGAPPMAGPMLERFGWTRGSGPIPTFIVTP